MPIRPELSDRDGQPVLIFMATAPRVIDNRAVPAPAAGATSPASSRSAPENVSTADHYSQRSDVEDTSEGLQRTAVMATALTPAAPQVVPIPRLPGTSPPCRCAPQCRASRCVTGVEPRRPSTRFDLRGSGGGLACWAAPGRSLCSAGDPGDLGPGERHDGLV